MKKYLSFALSFLAILGLFLGSGVNFAGAQTGLLPGAPMDTITDSQLGLQYGAATGLSQRDPRLTIAIIIKILLGVLGVVTVLIILYAGFLWMTSGGNDEKIGQAKGWMYGATIGLAIILSAYALANFVVRSLVQSTGYGVIPLF